MLIAKQHAGEEPGALGREFETATLSRAEAAGREEFAEPVSTTGNGSQ
jgi:hypothetical protein